MARRRKTTSKLSPTNVDENDRKPTRKSQGPKLNGLTDDNMNGAEEVDDVHDEEDVKPSFSFQAPKSTAMSPSTTVVHKKFGKISCLPPENPQSDSNLDSDVSSQDQLDSNVDSNMDEDQRTTMSGDGAELLEVVLAHEHGAESACSVEGSEGMEDNDPDTIVVEVEESMVDEIDHQNTVFVQVVGDELVYSEEDGTTIWEVETVEEVDNDEMIQDSVEIVSQEEVVMTEKEENFENNEDFAQLENLEDIAVNSVTSSGITEKSDAVDMDVSTSHTNRYPSILDSDMSDREVEEDHSAIRSKLSPDEITQMVLGLNCGNVEVDVEDKLCKSNKEQQDSVLGNQCRESVITRRNSDVDMDLEVNSRLKGNPIHVYGNPKKTKSPSAKVAESSVIQTNSEMVTPPRRNVICIDDSPLKSPPAGESSSGSRKDDLVNCTELPISSIGGSLFNVDLKSVTVKGENHEKSALKEQPRGIEPLGKKSKSGELEMEVKKSNLLRNRSGSSDTAGSDSGSRSPTVRRSSRIRTPAPLKKPSTPKAASDSSDINNDEPPSPSSAPSVRSSSSNSSALPDVSMPVKVKSRWRRSSELEMGGMGISEFDVGTTVLSPSQTLEPSPPGPPPSSNRALSEKELKIKKEEEQQELAERLKGYEILKENLYLTER